MNAPRRNPSATVLNGYIFVAGGRDNQSSVMNSVELYDTKSDEWVQLTPMEPGRDLVAFMVSNRFVYAIGLEDAIERYDPWKTCWTEVRIRGNVKIFKILFYDLSIAFRLDQFLAVGALQMELKSAIFVIFCNGSFAKIKFEDNGKCSLFPLFKSKYNSNYLGRHFLFHHFELRLYRIQIWHRQSRRWKYL